MRPMQFYEFGNIRGRFAYLDVRKAPFMNKDGSCQGTVGCGIDITHLHAAMSALTLEKDKVIKLFNQHYLYDLLNSVPFYIWLKDKDGKFLWVNRHHQNIGKKWELIVGKSTEEFMQMFMTHPYGYHIAQIKSEDERAKEGDITISDSERITQDGELLNLKTFRFPIVSDNGEIVAIGGVHIEMKLLGMECEK
jgi:PAS domain-containing protein